jgi:hypothetical protein
MVPSSSSGMDTVVILGYWFGTAQHAMLYNLPVSNIQKKEIIWIK